MPALGPSAIAGACAGLVSSIVTCPLDVVKTKLQAQTSQSKTRSSASTSTIPKTPKPLPHPTLAAEGRQLIQTTGSQPSDRVYKGLIGTLRTIYRDDGIRGFYRGLGPTIFGYLPTWAIYFTVYDGCKEMLASGGGKRQRGDEDFLNHILSALTAGAASTICTSPLWVVKTRFMLQSAKPTSPHEPPPYRHTLDAFIRIMQSEGPRGFYRGLLPSLMGVSHVAVQFPLYETFKSWARSSKLTKAQGQNLEGAEISPKIILLCSSTAKMIASVLTYPHEVVRTRLQMQPRARPDTKSVGTTARLQPEHAGGPHHALTQGTADSKRLFSTAQRHPSIVRACNAPSSFQKAHLFTSSRTAASEQSASLKYTGVIKTVRTILAEEGIRGFYNGMGVNLIRTVPSSALTILTYEIIMSHLTAPVSPQSTSATRQE